MGDHFLTPVELSARWDIPVGTLANWRSDGTGPTYLKLGKGVRYAIAEVVRYETAHAITPRRPERTSRAR